MWTAVRLLTVCVLGVSGLMALRSGLPSRQPPPLPAIHGGAADRVLVNLTAKEDKAPINEKKMVAVEPIRIASLQACQD